MSLRSKATVQTHTQTDPGECLTWAASRREARCADQSALPQLLPVSDSLPVWPGLTRPWSRAL